jgi:hypothetical protein
MGQGLAGGDKGGMTDVLCIYDIALTKRALAVGLGAVEISWRQASCMAWRRRITGELGSPASAEQWVKSQWPNSDYLSYSEA